MKRNFLSMVVGVVSLLVLFNFAWGQCPEEPKDLGECDTLNVVPWPETDTCFIAGTDTICINNPGEDFPCFLQVPLLVTHDSNTFWWETESRWVQDSIAAFVIPLTFWHPPDGCVDSVILPNWDNWNNTAMNPYDPRMPKSIFRDFVDEDAGDTLQNRMGYLASLFQGLEWASILLDIDSHSSDGDSGHAWLGMLPTSPTNRRWWEGSRELLVTFTFIVYKSEGCDGAKICFDSTFWPPASRLTFTRHDAVVYFPRHNLPLCVWVGPPRIEVTSPNGGETLTVGQNHDITWISDGLDSVTIEYSTDGGSSFTMIDTAEATKGGSYPWQVPDTPSDSCRVRICDIGGALCDTSDSNFTITAPASITVTSPNGGETWIVDSAYNITWTSSGVDSITIEYSTDGGSSFTMIDTTEATKGGSYPWQVPDTPSDSCRVRICDIGGALCDTSDSDFSIVRPDFTIEAEPETLTVVAGESVGCDVILNSLYGFSSSCTLTVDEDSLPASTTYDFNPATVVPTDTSILTFHTDASTPPDTSTIIVTGSEMSKEKNGVEHSTPVVLIVTPPADFAIDVTPDTLTVPWGDSGDYKVILTSIDGFASNCTLTVVGHPDGSTPTFDPPVLVPTDSAILTIEVPDTVTPDTFTLTITATELDKSKGIAHSDSVTLIVTLPTWAFKIEASPDTQIVVQGDPTTYEVTIIPNVGFTALCTLFVIEDSLPSGATADFDPNPIPPNDTSTLTITTLVTTPVGEYDLPIVGVANFKQKDTTYVKLIVEEATDVDGEGDQPNVPDKFALFQNQPNPFNPDTKISYHLPEGCEVKLTIYNILGRKVRTLFEGYQNAGLKTLVWNGKDDQGKQLGSGIYFYRLQAGEFNQTRKMTVIK